ncbi:hypothetical protein GWK41_03865 [Persephonella atlantica]|uniref:Uncharacterized protein n=1 Tax=Persephonella atlantica TaxID=2699429 RepID=A0ABS1GGY8_9AQUI|nr:hypothetical protein [Persephonella atlantica]MBK3332204.1 hypothetical protein [Persephonella atlantica]
MENNIYVHYLISELENYIIDNKKKIESIIKNKNRISVEESVYIFDKFSVSLKKATDLIKNSADISDIETLKTVSIISSETVAWVMFTLPNVESTIPVFLENLIIGNRHVIDSLGELLLEIDEFIENPSKLRTSSNELYQMINEVAMFFGHLSSMMKKGTVEN